MKMHIPLAIISVIFALLACVFAWGALLEYRKPAPYTVLCSDDGRFNFMTSWSEPNTKDYATHEEAEAAAEEHRQWVVEYNATEGTKEEAERKAKAERAKRFHVCNGPEGHIIPRTQIGEGATGIAQHDGTLQIYWTYGDSPGVHVQRKRGGPVEWVPNGEARVPSTTPKPQDIPHVGNLFK